MAPGQPSPARLLLLASRSAESLHESAQHAGNLRHRRTYGGVKTSVWPTLYLLDSCSSSTPLFEAPTADLHDAVFSEVAWELEDGRFTRTTMVRTDRYKLAVDDLGRSLILFDMVEDPQEQRNLVGKPELSEIEGSLRERLLRFHLDTQWEQHVKGARLK